MTDSSTGKFYNEALSCNRPLEDYEKDSDGIWRLKDINSRSFDQRGPPPSYTQPIRLDEIVSLLGVAPIAHDNEDDERDHDTFSVSSTIVEIEPDVCGGDEGKTVAQGVYDSIVVSMPPTRSGTPVARMRKECVHTLLKGIGDNLFIRDPQTQSRRLEETYERYQDKYVDFRKRQACKKMEAVLSNAWPSSSSEDPFQLAVLSHDELCRSNGLVRINEERSAVCVAIRDDPERLDISHPHFCEVCILPPDYYEVSTN